MATILCIDDDPEILETHKALLESKGYKVLTAPDGPTAIAVSHTHSIDAVVLDFSMPGMNGDRTAQLLRQEQPSVPVIIYSGCPDEIPESLKWFADSLLHKGDGPHALLSVVEKIVNATSTRKKPAPGKLSNYLSGFQLKIMR